MRLAVLPLRHGPRSAADAAHVANLALAACQDRAQRVGVVTRIHRNPALENARENVAYAHGFRGRYQDGFGRVSDCHSSKCPRDLSERFAASSAIKPFQSSNRRLYLRFLSPEIGQDHSVGSPIIVHLQSLDDDGIETATRPLYEGAPRAPSGSLGGVYAVIGISLNLRFLVVAGVLVHWPHLGVTSPGPVRAGLGLSRSDRLRRVAQAESEQSNTQISQKALFGSEAANPASQLKRRAG